MFDWLMAPINAIWEFLSQMVQILFSIGDFVKMLVKGLGTILFLIPRGMAFLFQSIAYVPDIIAPFIVVTVTVSVVLFIIGRQSKG